MRIRYVGTMVGLICCLGALGRDDKNHPVTMDGPDADSIVIASDAKQFVTARAAVAKACDHVAAKFGSSNLVGVRVGMSIFLTQEKEPIIVLLSRGFGKSAWQVYLDRYGNVVRSESFKLFEGPIPKSD